MKTYSTVWNRCLLGGILATGLAAGGAFAADSKDAARAVFARAKDAVITVSAVVKVEIPGRGSEGQPVETSCTVIGADGLAVVSATALNPVAAALDAIASMGEDRMQSKPKVELTQVKYRLADATEVPARLVYKDKDLDLAFLVPDLKEDEKAPKFTSLEVKAGPKAQELDDIISVTRLAKNMSYTPAVSIGQIVAVVTKPRTVYDFALNGTPATGTPIFNNNGDLLGFTFSHQDGGGSERALRSMMSGGGGEIIILPAGEVADMVEQARKAAAKKEAKTEPDSSESEKKDKE